MRHENAIIWLQEDEEEGAADCGCRLINDSEGARFIMCRRHSLAFKLAKELESLKDQIFNADESWFSSECEGFSLLPAFELLGEFNQAGGTQ